MRRTSSSIFHSLSAVITSLLSCSTCPGCITIYAALFSLMGIELFEYNVYFFPLMILSICFTAFLMARQVVRHKTDYRPLIILSLSACTMIWSAAVGQELLLYGALPFFMGAIFLNRMITRKLACDSSCSHKCSHAAKNNS